MPSDPFAPLGVDESRQVHVWVGALFVCASVRPFVRPSVGGCGLVGGGGAEYGCVCVCPSVRLSMFLCV